MIKAISFDLWDTVIHDDSDEPKRSSQGLPSKRDHRRRLALQAFSSESAVEPSELEAAYNTMEAAFHHVWHEQHVTWTVSERVSVLESGLGRRLHSENFSRLVRELEEMEVTVAPDPVPGVAEALAELSRRYRLGVVSDAIYTPGRCLRQWLEMHDLKRYFSGFAFSDEVGRSKPHGSMFASLAEQLGVSLEEILHLGDRDHNDVKGPHALGMKAVLFTATRDRDKHMTTADAICQRYADLPAIVDKLAG